MFVGSNDVCFPSSPYSSSRGPCSFMRTASASDREPRVSLASHVCQLPSASSCFLCSIINLPNEDFIPAVPNFKLRKVDTKVSISSSDSRVYSGSPYNFSLFNIPALVCSNEYKSLKESNSRKPCCNSSTISELSNQLRATLSTSSGFLKS